MHRITLVLFYDGNEINNKDKWLTSYAKSIGFELLALVHEHINFYAGAFSSPATAVKELHSGVVIANPVLFRL